MHRPLREGLKLLYWQGKSARSDVPRPRPWEMTEHQRQRRNEGMTYQLDQDCHDDQPFRYVSISNVNEVCKTHQMMVHVILSIAELFR
jgi:hypothetical protein